VSNSHHPSSEFGLGRRAPEKICTEEGGKIWGKDGALGFGEKKRKTREREKCIVFFVISRSREGRKNLFPHIFHLSFFLNVKGYIAL